MEENKLKELDVDEIYWIMYKNDQRIIIELGKITEKSSYPELRYDIKNIESGESNFNVAHGDIIDVEKVVNPFVKQTQGDMK